MAFQPSLTETEQVEELMGFKEDIKIMNFFLNMVHIKVTDSETVAGHAKTLTNNLFLELKNAEIQISA